MGSTASSTSSALRRKRLEAELALQRSQAKLIAQLVDEEEEETFLKSVDGAFSREDHKSSSSWLAQWVEGVSLSRNPPQPLSVSQQPAETTTMALVDNTPAPASTSALDADEGPSASLSASNQPADQDTHVGSSSLAETTPRPTNVSMVSTTHLEPDNQLAHVTTTRNTMNTATSTCHAVTIDLIDTHTSVGMNMSTHDTLTTSSHPHMISQPTLATVSLPAPAPSAPSVAPHSFSLHLMASQPHVTTVALATMTHVHASSNTTSAPLSVVAAAPTAGSADVDADNHWIHMCFVYASVDVLGIKATGHASCSGDSAAVDVGDYSPARDAADLPDIHLVH